MSIPTYTLGYPPDGSSLGQTKAVVRNNLDGTFLTVGVDHINNNGQPGSQPAGYHTVIHEVSQTNVTTENTYNQIFSGIPGTLIVNGSTTPAIPNNNDTQLYALTGQGVLSQLTGHSATNNGYAWMGGILLQWGSTLSPGSSGSVSFPVVFPNNCFNVSLTQRRDGSSSTQGMYLDGVPSQSGFSYNGSTSSDTALYWMAIGN